MNFVQAKPMSSVGCYHACDAMTSETSADRHSALPEQMAECCEPGHFLLTDSVHRKAKTCTHMLHRYILSFW